MGHDGLLVERLAVVRGGCFCGRQNPPGEPIAGIPMELAGHTPKSHWRCSYRVRGARKGQGRPLRGRTHVPGGQERPSGSIAGLGVRKSLSGLKFFMSCSLWSVLTTLY